MSAGVLLLQEIKKEKKPSNGKFCLSTQLFSKGLPLHFPSFTIAREIDNNKKVLEKAIPILINLKQHSLFIWAYLISFYKEKLSALLLGLKQSCYNNKKEEVSNTKTR
ncbi:CLUMA_CG010804, isoform A [Clunio marinus]|uniref:CLUMA_CG010804, isoform A n=1 Tax=Clunio marinus TaxID=568069 RepID=A0A1J1IAV2_9DIPT|nr:CLUMA_CG010804, isoform A [Clunio marinus]